MSRCFPFPPPGYVKIGERGREVPIEIESTKLQKEIKKAEKERKREKKREKKEKKELLKKQQPGVSDGKVNKLDSKKPPLQGDGKKTDAVLSDNSSRSGLSEEHGQSIPENTFYLSDDTDSSKKRKRDEQSAPTVERNGTKLKLCFSFKKPSSSADSTIVRQEPTCSTSSLQKPDKQQLQNQETSRLTQPQASLAPKEGNAKPITSRSQVRPPPSLQKATVPSVQNLGIRQSTLSASVSVPQSTKAIVSDVVHKKASVSGLVHKKDSLSDVVHKKASVSDLVHKKDSLSDLVHKKDSFSDLVHKKASVSEVVPKIARPEPIVRAEPTLSHPGKKTTLAAQPSSSQLLVGSRDVVSDKGLNLKPPVGSRDVVSDKGLILKPPEVQASDQPSTSASQHEHSSPKQKPDKKDKPDRKDRSERKERKESKRRRRDSEIESMYNSLIMDWVAPAMVVSEEVSTDDQEWLFGSKMNTKAVVIPQRCDAEAANFVLPGCEWPPRTHYLAEAEIHALPFTVPF